MSTGFTETDRKILVHLYRLTTGNSWDDNNLDLGSCFGVKTNDEGRVVELKLRSKIKGADLSALGELSALETLNLSLNHLSDIPSALGGLSALETLDLSHNKLSGAIPSALGGLSALETLDLSYNQLSGTVPSALGGLSALETL
ncbi:unnamed protein product, partial [Ascophyllum nodosum]